MARTKNTPRSQTAGTSSSQAAGSSTARPICPVCHETIGAQEKFETHLVQCYKGRPKCSTCGKTFKKRDYLMKHEQIMHKSQGPQKCKQESSMPKPKPENSGEKSKPDKSGEKSTLEKSGETSKPEKEENLKGREVNLTVRKMILIGT